VFIGVHLRLEILKSPVLGVSPRVNKAQEQPMTGQSLYYLAEGNLQHKILAIVEEQGARKTGYGMT
jgi:hypothetical protein